MRPIAIVLAAGVLAALVAPHALAAGVTVLRGTMFSIEDDCQEMDVGQVTLEIAEHDGVALLTGQFVWETPCNEFIVEIPGTAGTDLMLGSGNRETGWSFESNHPFVANSVTTLTPSGPGTYDLYNDCTCSEDSWGTFRIVG